MAELSKVPEWYQLDWSAFRVKDATSVNTEVDIAILFASDNLILTALNLGKYSGYSGKGYGEGVAIRGVTEQEAYNIWLNIFNTEQRMMKKQLSSMGILTLPQSVYDGLMLFYWATRELTNIRALEGTYNVRDFLISKDYHTLASMVARYETNRQICIRAASIMMLADYGRNKTRKVLRQNGIDEMRRRDMHFLLDEDQIKRARFAYYAETKTFLSTTPDSVKRDIIKRYKETLNNFSWIYDGSTVTYNVEKEPSMDPIEKLSVTLNGEILVYNTDFTLSGTIVTITRTMVEGDIIFMQVEI